METRGLREGQDFRSIGPLYVIYFAGSHTNFRLAEFRAGADYLNVAYAFIPVPFEGIPWLEWVPEEERVSQVELELKLDSDEAKKGINVERPFMLVYLPGDEVVRQLCQRVTSIRTVWQQWSSGRNVKEVSEGLQRGSAKAKWMQFWDQKISWRATVLCSQRSLTMPEQIRRMEVFKDILDFQGPIKLKGADLDWGYIEEWTTPTLLPEEEEKGQGSGKLDVSKYEVEAGTDLTKEKRFQRQRLLSVHIGRKVADGKARELVSKMDVKKRKYIGNTTMESQMSLIQAGMALSGPGKIILDPFAGTCSLLLAAAVLGAHVMASDIDGRMMRGKVTTTNQEVAVLQSAKQYGVKDQFLDFICSDISQHPWKNKGFFDAIVADPPYGVRAGAKQLGRRDINKQRDEPFLLEDGTFSHQREDYLPPTKPYALNNLLLDLMNFSSKLLVPNGRLVFWMPTMIESVENVEGTQHGTMQDLDLELTADFILIAHSLQDFGPWGRRLITLQKVQGGDSLQRDRSASILPAPPASHRSVPERTRATDDPNEFRNRVSSRPIITVAIKDG